MEQPVVKRMPKGISNVCFIHTKIPKTTTLNGSKDADMNGGAIATVVTKQPAGALK